jgi:hypothetical protein
VQMVFVLNCEIKDHFVNSADFEWIVKSISCKKAVKRSNSTVFIFFLRDSITSDQIIKFVAY